jgi:hypothetical protein
MRGIKQRKQYRFFNTITSVKNEYWATGGMKLIGENRSTRIKTCPINSLSTTNPTQTGLGLNTGLRGDRLET